MATVKLDKVRKSFGSTEIIRGISLDIDNHELAVIVGPSGCGKSTLLRLIAGLEEVTSGDISIDGQRINDVPPARRGLAMVFQSYALYPHMSVAGNMGFSLKLAGVAKGERDRKVLEAARILQLESLLDRKPRDLSGGERQRVAIGRAIVRNPKVFLFDEPLSNLDAALRVQMRVEIMRLHEALRATMIYVTHDQIEAMTMADRIVVLQKGTIEQVGSPLDLYHHPANLFVAGFIGSPRMNLLPMKVSRLSAAGAELAFAGGAMLSVPVETGQLRPGESVCLGVRPEHLSLGSKGQFRGEVLVIERLGSTTFLHVQIPGDRMLTAEAGGESPIRAHDIVDLKINGDACHLFNAAGNAIARSC